MSNILLMDLIIALKEISTELVLIRKVMEKNANVINRNTDRMIDSLSYLTSVVNSK